VGLVWAVRQVTIGGRDEVPAVRAAAAKAASLVARVVSLSESEGDDDKQDFIMGPCLVANVDVVPKPMLQMMQDYAAC